MTGNCHINSGGNEDINAIYPDRLSANSACVWQDQRSYLLAASSSRRSKTGTGRIS